MAIAFRSQTSLGGTAATVSAIKPSGAVAGDILVVDIITAGATVTVVPSGWTAITNVQTGTTARLFAYWHAVGASDPGPWDFTLSVSGAYSHICACYSGVDNTTPLDVAATTVGNNTAGSSIVVPAVSPVTANTMLHSGVGEGATNRTITNPTGMTSIVEVTVGRRQEAAWQAIAATGTTGTRTWTFSATAVYNAYMVPLRPATNVAATLVGTAATATAAAGASTFVGDVDAILYVDSTVTSSAAVTANTAITIAKPVGLQDNDYVLMVVGSRAAADSTFTVSGGTGTWSELAHAYNGTAAPSLALWGKRVVTAASEPTNYTYQFNQSAQSFAAASAYRGVDQTTPIHATATAATGSDDTAEQTLTPTVNKTMLVFVTGYAASTSTTQTGQPSGYSQREHNTSQMRGSLFDAYQAVAAASSPVETNSGPELWAAHLVALNPITATGTPATLVGTAATATTRAEASAITAASTLTGTAATSTTAAGASALLGQAKLTGTAASATSQAGASAVIAASKLIAGSATATAQAEPSTFRAAAATILVAGTATATTQAEASALAGQGNLAATAATATAQASASAITAASKLIAAAATATAQAEASNFSAGGAVVFTGGTATANAAAPQSTLAGQAKLAVTAATATAAAGASTFGVAATFAAGTATATAAAGASSFKAASKLIAASATATAQAESSSFLAGGAVTFAAGTATASAAASASTMRAGASLLGNTALANATAPVSAFFAASRFTAGSATASAQAEPSMMFAGLLVIPPRPSAGHWVIVLPSTAIKTKPDEPNVGLVTSGAPKTGGWGDA